MLHAYRHMYMFTFVKPETNRFLVLILMFLKIIHMPECFY